MFRSIVVVVILFVCGGSFADGVLDEVKSSVKDCWRRLSKETAGVMELREKRKALPDSSFWFWETDKKDQDAKIRERLLDVRELLLSTDSRKIMKEVDEIDEDIAEIDEDIREATEERALDLDRETTCAEKIEKLRRKRAKIESRRHECAAKVCAELRELGLKVGGEAAEQCLFPVNFGELIDGVIVSRNVACVVENLRSLMSTGDVALARRYFGMYLVMVDVQVVCFEDYLEKSRTGSWRQGVNRILAEAKAARDEALKSARDDSFTAEQRTIFSHNSEINQATVRAAEAYLRVLDSYETVISGKLDAARRVRQVVASSYETVNLAGDFLALAKSNQEAFDSLLNLDLPPIEMFNDATVQQEFQAITKKLKE